MFTLDKRERNRGSKCGYAKFNIWGTYMKNV